MSGFILSRAAHRVEVVSDGGSYDHDGRLLIVYDKVRIAPGLPLALMLRGESKDFCDTVADLLLGIASQERSVDHMLAKASEILRSLEPTLAERPIAECTIAGFSESRGPIGVMVQTHRWEVDGHPVEVGQLQDLAPLFVAGVAAVQAAELVAAGLTLPPAPLPPDMLEEHGVAAMEVLRCKPMSADDMLERYGVHRDTYMIGGHVQYVGITPEGATSRILKVWPDEIGKPITPACEAVQ